MPLLNLKQGTKEWHNYRKDRIGASMAPVIMGVSPWQTPLQLWEELQGIREPKIKTQRMQRGLDLEQRARNLFLFETGICVLDAVYQHDKIDWMFASLDGISEDGRTIVEIKCPGEEDHLIAKNQSIPEKYFPQIQHQMAVTNLDNAFYVSYDGEDIVIVEAFRDQEYIDKLIEEETKFLKRVRTFDAPPMTERDVVLMRSLEWNATCETYKDYIRYQKQIEEKLEKIKSNLIILSQGKNCKGNQVCLTKVARKGNVDYSQIDQLKGLDLDKYRKPMSSYWKITIDGDE